MTPIVVAPFSNSSIRDWPIGHFARLITLLLERVDDAIVHVIGVANQKFAAREIVRFQPADRVINQCGVLAWPTVLGLVREAGCVIGNNSGVSHIAGHLGAPTVCIFGGSHQRMEWHPKGANVIVVSRAIGCSPCQLDHNHVSPYGKACLTQIEPETVAEAALLVMARASAAREAPMIAGVAN